jgi:hypothetical protein
LPGADGPEPVIYLLHLENVNSLSSNLIREDYFPLIVTLSPRFGGEGWGVVCDLIALMKTCAQLNSLMNGAKNQ